MLHEGQGIHVSEAGNDYVLEISLVCRHFIFTLKGLTKAPGTINKEDGNEENDNVFVTNDGTVVSIHRWLQS